MSNDRITEVTRESWFSRIGGAVKGIVVGFILFAVAFPLLFWNEGRAVKRYKTLKEGSGAVVSVTADTVDPANAGKLVHMAGRADTEATLKDPVFGVSANALRLNRNVEMYQWKESSESKTKKKLGGGTETTRTYTYSKTWSDRLIDSADFKEPTGHQNPGSKPYESTELVAEQVRLGAFMLSPSLVRQISNFEPLPAAGDTELPEALKGKASLHGGGLYLGADPASPQVGDTRISFEVARPTEVSLIAEQAGATFAPYKTKAGGSLEMLETGVHTAEAMFQQAQESNRILTWMLRLAGFVLMLIGLNMMLKLLSVLADVLPILGNIVGAGTGLISFLLAAILSLITIAIAWIVFRPLLGIILIAVAIGLIVAIKSKLKPAGTASQT
ncbi:MAG: TMEM43 family protein [Kiritimatiellae bacterium]|nr:TMEM43 family protein [Kiritimatiellia bacterium]